MILNSVLVGALAVAVGFLLWAGLITGGFAAFTVMDYVKDKASAKQVFWSTVAIVAILICYATGMVILTAAGAI